MFCFFNDCSMVKRATERKIMFGYFVMLFFFALLVMVFFCIDNWVISVLIILGLFISCFSLYLVYYFKDKFLFSSNDFNKIKWLLEKANPYDFEEMVADMFRNSGYQSVKVTKKSGDVGADIIMKRNGIKYIVQVKKYGEGNKIGRPDLQKLQGSAQHFHVIGIIFVTYGFFSSSALNYAKKHGIETIDHNELLKKFSKIFKPNTNKFFNKQVFFVIIFLLFIIIISLSALIVYFIMSKFG